MAGEDRIGAGFRYIFYGVADSNGYLQGNSSTPATSGTIQPLLRLRGARTFPVSVPERDRVVASGDDEPLAVFTFASEELPSGVMAVAVRDLDFEALTQGTVAETIGDLKAGSLAAAGESGETMMLLLMREAKKYEGAVKGVGAWEILLIPSAEVTPLGAEWEQRTFSPYNYGVALSKSARAIYGATYTEGLRGTTEMAIEPIFSDNPIMIEGGYGDGSTVAYNLSYEPVAANNSKIHVYLNGVRKTYGAGAPGFTVSGQTLTFGTAPGNGVHIGIMYEVDATDLG